MTGAKTNERPGTRAVLRNSRMSAYKARQVLDLIREQDVDRAIEVLRDCPRGAADVVAKVLASAVANARHNDELDAEDLYVSACFADEGTTLKRWRPRARGRATRVRKRSCHITVIVGELPEERLARRRERRQAEQAAMRARRVAGGRRARRAGDAPAGTSAARPGRSGASAESAQLAGAGAATTQAQPGDAHVAQDLPAQDRSVGERDALERDEQQRDALGGAEPQAAAAGAGEASGAREAGGAGEASGADRPAGERNGAEEVSDDGDPEGTGA